MKNKPKLRLFWEKIMTFWVTILKAAFCFCFGLHLFNFWNKIVDHTSIVTKKHMPYKNIHIFPTEWFHKKEVPRVNFGVPLYTRNFCTLFTVVLPIWTTPIVLSFMDFWCLGKALCMWKFVQKNINKKARKRQFSISTQWFGVP